MGDVIGRGVLCTLTLACAVRMGIETRPVEAQSVESSGLEFPSDGSYLRLQAPGNEAYQALDGYRMKQLVAEQTAIARRYRDAGHQYGPDHRHRSRSRNGGVDGRATPSGGSGRAAGALGPSTAVGATILGGVCIGPR